MVICDLNRVIFLGLLGQLEIYCNLHNNYKTVSFELARFFLLSRSAAVHACTVYIHLPFTTFVCVWLALPTNCSNQLWGSLSRAGDMIASGGWQAW